MASEEQYVMYLACYDAFAYSLSHPETYLERAECKDYNVYKKTITYFILLLLASVLSFVYEFI